MRMDIDYIRVYRTTSSLLLDPPSPAVRLTHLSFSLPQSVLARRTSGAILRIDQQQLVSSVCCEMSGATPN